MSLLLQSLFTELPVNQINETLDQWLSQACPLCETSSFHWSSKTGEFAKKFELPEPRIGHIWAHYGLLSYYEFNLIGFIRRDGSLEVFRPKIVKFFDYDPGTNVSISEGEEFTLSKDTRYLLEISGGSAFQTSIKVYLL